jgi:hypothetical protein
MNIEKALFLLGPFASDKLPSKGLLNEWKRIAEQAGEKQTIALFIVNHDGFSLRNFAPNERNWTVA